MGLLRNMPGGLLHRDPPDHQRKGMQLPVLISSVNSIFQYIANKGQYGSNCLSAGIMQLALLAPYNNLASSVAAALVPTLLTPKIRITDENDHTFSYGSDSNSQATDTNQQHNNAERGKAL